MTSTHFFIYLALLLMAFLGSLFRIRRRDIASKIVITIVGLTVLTEITAYVAAVRLNNNMFVYHIFAPIQLLLIGLYFDNSVVYFKKRKIGLYTGLLGIVFACFNSLFLQPIVDLNSNFLLFEGLVIMAMALYSFQIMLRQEDVEVLKNQHFWLTLTFLFFWSMTYTTWALYSALRAHKTFLLPYVSVTIWATNVITYIGLGLIFIKFRPKKQAE